MEPGKLFIISGTTGAGKNTIVAEFLKNTKIPFAKIITYTTRPPRPGETQGVDYHFVSENEFADLIKQGVFLEWAKVHDHKYGSPKKDVLKALEQGQNVILIIDVQGALAVKKSMPEAILIFITLENFSEIEKRFLKRHGQVTPELNIRLQSAKKELEQINKYDYKIINYTDQLPEAVNNLADIINKEINSSVDTY